MKDAGCLAADKLIEARLFDRMLNLVLQTIAFPFNRKSPAPPEQKHTPIRDDSTFGGHSVTNTSAVRFPLTLARALVRASPFEVEAALIVVRDLALHVPPYLMLLSQAAEDAILAARGRPDSSETTIAREALERFANEIELHELAEQHASHN